jgi:hypothetical protein
LAVAITLEQVRVAAEVGLYDEEKMARCASRATSERPSDNATSRRRLASLEASTLEPKPSTRHVARRPPIPQGRTVFGAVLSEEMAGDADGVVSAPLSCSVPTAMADLKAGETVLDLGFGWTTPSTTTAM